MGLLWLLRWAQAAKSNRDTLAWEVAACFAVLGLLLGTAHRLFPLRSAPRLFSERLLSAVRGIHGYLSELIAGMSP